ncbi:MAG: hypothetical protein QOC68_1273 [Solirubrobacteraceae bacterium]|nr:hypothetical protein [Solirubrobacteraceae bacterium]
MDKTTTAPPSQGRFARESEPPKPPSPAPPADLAAVRAIQRRWPRTVPATRVFPRG